MKSYISFPYFHFQSRKNSPKKPFFNAFKRYSTKWVTNFLSKSSLISVIKRWIFTFTLPTSIRCLWKNQWLKPVTTQLYLESISSIPIEIFCQLLTIIALLHLLSSSQRSENIPIYYKYLIYLSPYFFYKSICSLISIYTYLY